MYIVVISDADTISWDIRIWTYEDFSTNTGVVYCQSTEIAHLGVGVSDFVLRMLFFGVISLTSLIGSGLMGGSSRLIGRELPGTGSCFCKSCKVINNNNM